jgi:fermentation-respiration switch protein FrsA (DUF1100 family)
MDIPDVILSRYRDAARRRPTPSRPAHATIPAARMRWKSFVIPSRGALIRAALLVLVFPAGLLIFEKKLIYFPARELELAPSDLGLRSEEAPLVGEDGVRIHAWFLPRPGSRLTVLVSHGNAGNISHRLHRAALLEAALDADVLLYDYRGYGRSEGAPDEEGTYRDSRAAYRYLVEGRGVRPERLVLFGESLGSAVTLELALTHPCAAVVLESPFTSIRDMVRVALPLMPLGAFVRTRYDNLAKVGKLRVPLLVMHGDRDGVVPFEQGQRLFAAAPEPKRFFRIAGADHNDTYLKGGEPYRRALAAFVADYAADAASR